jgi:hypothetical protein
MTVEDIFGLVSDDSDEEYDSESSEESEDYDPWGTTGPQSSTDIGPRERKERIRRKGRIPLNLTSSYGRRSGWGVREGIRELLQNLFPPLLKT